MGKRELKLLLQNQSHQVKVSIQISRSRRTPVISVNVSSVEGDGVAPHTSPNARKEEKSPAQFRNEKFPGKGMKITVSSR
ncbi:unnamed protein product, partial [Coregonus sp. 'balchen']